MAEINRLAYLRETVAMFVFKNWPDEANMRSFFHDRLGECFKQANTEVFKAVNTATNEMVGFVSWTLEEVGEAPTTALPVADTSTSTSTSTSMSTSTSTAKVLQREMPQFFNAEFFMRLGAQVEEMMGLMRGEAHYYLSAFAVEPRFQNQGVGTQLVLHCLPIAEEAALKTSLISFLGSHSLYMRMGFEDVDHRDVDLELTASMPRFVRLLYFITL